MTISDVIFYKNLGLQLKEICGMEASTPKQHQELFAKKIVELKRQQEIAYKTYEEAALSYAGSGNAGNAESTAVSGNRY